MNRKKILAAVLSAAVLIAGTGVYAAAAEAETQPAEVQSDFVKPGTDGIKITPASPKEKRGVQHVAGRLKKLKNLETKAGQAASMMTRSKDQAEEMQETAVQTAAVSYEAEILAAASRSPLYSAAADKTEVPAAAAEPVYTEPVYTETVYTSPLYAGAVYTEPVYAEPVYSEPVYSEPVYTEPVYTEPVYTEPVYTETADTGLSYVEETAGTDLYYGDALYQDAYAATDYSEETASESTTQRASASDSDLDLLASIIYCEAGGESYEGQVAVGAVVLNRMESELYPSDMTDVIYQSGQFTPAMTGWLDQVMESGVPDYCYDAAEAALAGENPVGDCLYFHAGGGDGLTIGNQTFY